MTKERLSGKGRVIKANLNSYLDFLEDEEFDIILSSMVIHYIKDWQILFSEFNRVLKKTAFLFFPLIIHFRISITKVTVIILKQNYSVMNGRLMMS
ncbi:MAG: methyltransferase domain-containing protein [Ignavibacteria bacterium]